MINGLFWTPSANAITVGFAPASQTVGVGDPVLVDVVISDLDGEIVSAYDLDVLYDPSILSATSVVFGSFLGDPFFFEVFEDFDILTAGVVDIAALSLLSDAALLALQPGSITLATLSFNTLGVGTSALSFSFDASNDVKGLSAQVLTLTVGFGSVAVVPEPSTLLLLIPGLAALAVRRRKRAHGPH